MSTISILASSMESVADSLDDPVNVDELLYLICLAAVDAVRGGNDQRHPHVTHLT